MADRREMADLLRQNREASARIRTENIIVRPPRFFSVLAQYS